MGDPMVSSWMGDPMVRLVMDLIFFLYTEFTPGVSQDSGSIFLCSMETCSMGIEEVCS